jgi:hypothetical protein
MEGHRLAQTVACGDLSSENPAPITVSYERQADPVIELQLQKAGVRLVFNSFSRSVPNTPWARAFSGFCDKRSRHASAIALSACNAVVSWRVCPEVVAAQMTAYSQAGAGE